jgi:hypothetical protein
MTSLVPRQPVRVVAYGFLLWLTGMIVGSVVFATPQLKATPAIPYLTANPFITFPIIALWSLLAWALTRKTVSLAPDPRAEGLRIGLVFLVTNAVLDLLLVVGAMRAGISFYSYAGLWFAYGVLVIAPWFVGHAAALATAALPVRI